MRCQKTIGFSQYTCCVYFCFANDNPRDKFTCFSTSSTAVRRSPFFSRRRAPFVGAADISPARGGITSRGRLVECLLSSNFLRFLVVAAWPLCVKGAVTTLVVTGGLSPSAGRRLSKYLCDNPSATADAVPPPFTQGRLWFSYVFEKVVTCLQTHIFSFLSLSLAGIASARKHWVSSLISRCGIPTNSRSICTIINSGSRIRRQRSNG